MSRSIDERIVEMQFENGEFERNARTTLGTIDKLKDALNFNNTASGLDKLSQQVNGISFADISDNLDALNERFSTLGIIGMQAIARITDAVIDLGVHMANDLVFDQISAGFQKYESVTKDIVAIMNQTGRSEEEVNKYVNQLSWYSDVTSFDFNSMTSAVKSFAAQGIDLEQAIPVIMGIGNSVTYAGQAAKEGSAAFDAYSKAISAGYLDNRNWITLSRSLGVGTLQLKQQFIQAAEALGTLDYVGDGVWKTMDGLEVTIESFQQTLGAQKGKWLTTEVMMQVFGKEYGGYTDKLAAFTKEYEKQNDVSLTLTESTELLGKATEELINNFGTQTVSEAMDELEKVFGTEYAQKLLTFSDEVAEKNKGRLITVADAINYLTGNTDELGLKYLESATKARTFTEAIDAVKDGVSSVWKDIFTDIFGGTTEAINLWTTFSDAIYDLVVTPIRNLEVLMAGWKDLGGRTFAIEAFARAFKNVGALLSPIKDAFKNIFPEATSDDLVRLTASFTNLQFKIKGFINNTLDLENLRKTFEGIFAVVDILKEVFLQLFDASKPLGGVFTDILNGFLKFTGAIGEKLVDLRNYVRENELFYDILSKLTGVIDPVREKLKELFTGSFKVDSELAADAVDKLKNAFEGIKKVVDPIIQSLVTGLKNVKDGIVESLHALNLEQLFDLAKGGLFTAILTHLSHFAARLREGFGLWATAGDIEYYMDVFTRTVNKFQAKIKAQALQKVSTALLILAGALMLLAAVNTENLASSMVAITALFYELTESLTVISTLKFATPVYNLVPTLIAFSTSILILAAAVKVLGNLDPDAAFQGLINVFALMTELAVFLKFAKFDKIGISAGAGLVAMSTGLVILVGAVALLGNLKTETLQKGLGSLAVMLIEIGIALNLMPKNMLSIGAGLAVVSTAILVMSGAMRILGGMDISSMGVALLGLGGAILILAAGANAMQSAIGGVLALGVAAASLILLAPALAIIASINPTGIAVALAALAGTFVILGVAATILTPVIPAILGLAGALALIGVGALAFGAGVTMIAAGLAALAASIEIGVAAIIGSLRLIIQGIIDMAADIIRAVGVIIEAICTALVTSASSIAEAAFSIIDALFTTIDEHLPSIIDSGMSIVIALLDGLITYMPVLVEKTVELVVMFIFSVADTISTESETIMAAIANLINSAAIFILEAVKALLGDIPFVGDKISNSIDNIVSDIRDTMDENKAKTIGEGFGTGLSEGIQSQVAKVEETTKLLSDTAKHGVQCADDFETAGEDSGKGFAKGLGSSSVLSKIANAASNMARKARNTLNYELQIESPSKVFAWSGEMSAEGFALGMEESTGIIAVAAEEMGNSAVKAMEKSMNGLYDAIDSDIDYNPVITPVLDLTQIQNGANNLDAMLSGGSINARLTGAVPATLYASDMTAQISGLRSDINRLAMIQTESLEREAGLTETVRNILEGMGVYMDGDKVGRLVTRYQSNVRRASGV